MTTSTDQFGGFPPPPPLPPDSGATPPGSGPTPPSGGPRPSRVLRRSRTDRVGAGVAGGLGEYFTVDPVLFRVLFATAAFFGGAGVLAYLVAWVAIPEQGTVNAPVDRFVGELRRRKVPVWVVALAAGLAFWGLAFSWWAPGHFFPVIVVVIVLVAVFGRRARRGYAATPWPDGSSPAGDTVNLSKQEPSDGADPSQPAWVGETRSWVREARIASRQRRRRALPVRLATIGVLVVALAILAAIDAGVGIAIPVYFWVTFGIVLGGLVGGLALRRTPWSVAALLAPTVAGLIAFGGTRAQLHDGIGQKDWAPTSADALKSTYRLAFGQGILDLTHVGAIVSARTVDITLAAGEVRILVPPTLNATVEANVHFGNVSGVGSDPSATNGSDSRGVNVSRTILPGPAATGPAVTINVHVADGNIAVTHTN
ncbi:MAG: PspC domain-containing protein [Actinomycetota bacterium]|nr:PspC domain-containing protein [Actinomycetota bacterium]